MMLLVVTVRQLVYGEFHLILYAIFLGLHLAAWLTVLSVGWVMITIGVIRPPASMPIGLSRPNGPLTHDQARFFRILLVSSAIYAIVCSGLALFLLVIRPDAAVLVTAPMIIGSSCFLFGILFWSYRRAQRILP